MAFCISAEVIQPKNFTFAGDFYANARSFQYSVHAVAQQAAVGALLQLFTNDGINIRTRRQIQFFGDGCFVVDAFKTSGFCKSNAGWQIVGKRRSKARDRFKESGFAALKCRVELGSCNLGSF